MVIPSLAESVIDFSNLGKEEREVLSELERYKADLEAINRTAKNEALAEGKAEGLAEGIDIGKAEGKAEGLAEGIDIGKAEGLAEGIDIGKAEGLAEGIDIGKTEGLAEGIDIGKAETRLVIARNLKAVGVDKASIVKASGLTAKEVDAL